MLFGFFLPPFAVALRFGIGKDFFLNCFLCICGYIPSHFHNFYLQNIRNNTGKGRTPKWALKYGLVDDSESKRRKAKSQWAGRYDERNPNSTLVGAELAEGEEGENYNPPPTMDPEEVERRKKAGLWTREEEEYYGEDSQEAPNQRHWHYPANFEGVEGGEDADRWERTRAARESYAAPTASKPSKKSKKSKRSDIAAYAPSANSYGNGNANPLDSAYDDDVPEWGREYGAPKSGKKNRERSGTGGSYGSSNEPQGNGNGNANGNAQKAAGATPAQENWDHQF